MREAELKKSALDLGPTSFTWWVPGGSLTYTGSAKPRSEWVLLTFGAYLGWWKCCLIVYAITRKWPSMETMAGFLKLYMAEQDLLQKERT